MVVLFDHPDAFSTGVRANSIFASNGSESSDSSKNSCDRPTPYANTVVMTRDARKTPAITAIPRSLPRQALCPARRKRLGNSINECWYRRIRERPLPKSLSFNSVESSLILLHLPHQDPKQNVCRMLLSSHR